MANNFDKPGNSQYENLALLSKQFADAKTNYSFIKNKELSKLEKTASRYNLEAMVTSSFDDFLKNYK